MEPQFIVLCLDDDGRYVQTTRRRFDVWAVTEYADSIAESRKALIVSVNAVELDENGYPKSLKQ